MRQPRSAVPERLSGSGYSCEQREHNPQECECSSEAALTPNDFRSLSELEDRLLTFQEHYQSVASPFNGDSPEAICAD